MKVLSVACPKCGAPVSLDAANPAKFCQYCGTPLVLDDEVSRHKIDEAERLGYEMEMGRLRAQREAAGFHASAGANAGAGRYGDGGVSTAGSYPAGNRNATAVYVVQQPASHYVFTRNKHIFVWLWAFYFGIIGADRFARGQVGLGLLKFFTVGGFGIWYAVDLIVAATKAYLSGNTTNNLYFDHRDGSWAQ